MRVWIVFVLLVLAGPARAEWLVAETEHFRLHAQTSEKVIRERAALLEDYRSLLRAMTSRPRGEGPAEPKLDIYMVRRIGEARPFSTVPSSIAGFYRAEPGGVVAYAETGELGLATLLHEYAHHFMLASGAAAYPAWYVEGFAEYFMTATFKPERIQLGLHNVLRAAWLVNGIWLPLDRVLARQVRTNSRQENAMFYAQSWAMTHFLFRADGQLEKLNAYLAAVGRGGDPVDAFKAHVSPDLNAFQSQIKAYLYNGKMNYTQFKRSAATPASVKVRRLSPAADDLLLPLAELELEMPGSPHRDRAVDIIGQAAARHPGDPMAERALALLALRFGKREEAARRLDAMLESQPDDARLLLWRAEATPQDDDDGATQARRYLVRSYKANPEDWRTLWAYALARGSRTRTLSENDLNVLIMAWELAPQVGVVAIDLAIAYVHADRLDVAAHVLGPVAHDPHGRGMSPFAQRLLAAAEGGDRAGFLALMRGGPEAEAEEGEVDG
ncbi:DUF1570 domain-containing protein [Polymorphobacter sp.]|uniref:DUF1570 domain-containing protein n=1 Tax=Polymorphobacter sp. TaxID=1909290 RepID=UPI003F724C14